MTKQDISEKQAKIVYLSIGSNLGNRINNIEKSKYKLSQKGVKIIKISNYYEMMSTLNKLFKKKNNTKKIKEKINIIGNNILKKTYKEIDLLLKNEI